MLELRRKLDVFEENAKRNNSSQKIDSLQNAVINSRTNQTNFGKYKRGELGDKDTGISSHKGRVVTSEDFPVDLNNTGVTKVEFSKQRGDSGIVEEIENPDRHLRDRLHENGVPDHEKVLVTEKVIERAGDLL